MKHAADGSGTVMFELDDVDVTGSSDSVSNASESIPAGVTADDVLNLVVTYVPDGDMGEGEFEIQLPSGWTAADVLTSGDESTTKSGDPVHTVTTKFLNILGRLGPTQWKSPL